MSEDVDNLTARFIDLRAGATENSNALSNLASGTWDKYAQSGNDVNIEDAEAIAVLFDRTASGTAYLNSLMNLQPASDTINAKRSSDMLASMQQAMGLRYTSRMRSIGAVVSRLRAIGASDAELMKVRVQNV